MPRVQPGWWLDLDGPFVLDEPVTLSQLRDRADDVRSVLEQLKAARGGSLYFPFFFWGGSELRPMQPYLNKLPAQLVDVFPQLTTVAAEASATRSVTLIFPPSAASELGVAYREAEVIALPLEREPFTVDPALVERGLKGDADTQNELARILRDAGIEPRSRLPKEPNYDLAWESNGAVFVAEIKCITDQNEEGQLRLGLGQVLRSRQRLLTLGHTHVIAVLVPERPPRDSSWRELCDELGVVLLSKEQLDKAPTLATERAVRSAG